MTLRESWTSEQRAAERQRQARTKQLLVRLPPELHRQLQIAAEERELSMNYLATKAIEEFIERLIPADEWRLTR